MRGIIISGTVLKSSPPRTAAWGEKTWEKTLGPFEQQEYEHYEDSWTGQTKLIIKCCTVTFILK
jgi:hypothetical protein